MPQPTDIWIQKSTHQFFRIIKEAKPCSEPELVARASNLLHEGLTTFPIFRDVNKTLHEGLNAIHSSQNPVVLRLDCLDPQGNVWVSAWEWISELRGWFRKAMITTTLAAFGIDGEIEGTVLRMCSIKPNGLGRDDKEGKQAVVEEGGEIGDGDNEVDWIVVEKGCLKGEYLLRKRLRVQTARSWREH